MEAIDFIGERMSAAVAGQTRKQRTPRPDKQSTGFGLGFAVSTEGAIPGQKKS
jgi:hypothetical protein